ncbi:ATP-dependent helicase [Marinomonas algicola]|uniref:ATP-dependent helicase n=1 Tax=Marinomonas algicola TaxID=2773454 RepID=UPI001748F799|nr:ATP-dependent helicase [Marinomonas algicola]
MKTNNTSTFTHEQQQVIQHNIATHAKVVAVAGAGKTTTLIARIEFLLQQGVPIQKIGVFMFNKSAQEEFLQRLTCYLNERSYHQTPHVMTFHSFGLKLCRRMEQANLLSSADLITDDFSLVRLIREGMQQLVKKGKKVSLMDEKEWLEDALMFIDHVKAAAEDAHLVYKKSSFNSDRDFFPDLYNAIEGIRKRRNQRFFSDLTLDPLAAIEQDDLAEPILIQGLVPDYDYLLIDEFQDINPCQYRLLKALYKHSKWMIVGDVQQCIYEWRGANPHIMSTEFDEDFHQSDTTNNNVSSYALSQSFRFGHQVGLMASNTIDRNNAENLVIGTGNTTAFSFAKSEKAGQALLTELKQWVTQGERLDDVAVLVRLYSDMVPVQLALMHKNIPYHLHGDSPLLENRQIRMLLAYLAVMAEGFDNPQRFHSKQDIDYLLTVPSLSLSMNERRQFSQRCMTSPHLIPQLIEELSDQQEGWKGKKLQQRSDWLRSLALYRNDPAGGLQHTIEKLGIYRYFESTSSKDIQAKEKIATCDAFIAYVRGVGGTADDILDQLLALAKSPSEEDHNHGVHLMTIHKSKGLEFGKVIMTGLQEGRFPYYEKEVDLAQIEAERRLFYVGITRAKKRLVFLHQPTKSENKLLLEGRLSNKRVTTAGLSRFVFESCPFIAQQVIEAEVKIEQHQEFENIKMDNPKATQRYLESVSFKSAKKLKINVQEVRTLQVGDRVRHEKFGSGVVLNLDQKGNKMIIIDFDLEGVKTFNPKHTRLLKEMAT